MRLADQSLFDLLVARAFVRIASQLAAEPVSVLERLKEETLEDLKLVAADRGEQAEGASASEAIDRLFEIARRELRPEGPDREPPRIVPGEIRTNRTG